MGYDQLVELTTDGVWRYDIAPSVWTTRPPEEQAKAILARARLGYCNAAFARLYGFDRPDDLIGLSISDWLAGTAEEKLQFVARSIRKGYRFVNLEVATRGPGGRTIWTLNNVAGVVTRGRLVGGWGVAHDITDRKAAETALRDAFADLRATLDAFPGLVFEVDAAGRIHTFHARDPRQLYVAPEQFLGKTVEEVMPPDAARPILDALATAVRDGAYAGTRYALDMPGGRRWFDLSITAKPGEGGADARYIAVARDVTEKEEAAAALRASEERLALALGAASEGVFDVDLRTGKAYYSPGYYTMLGFAPGEFEPSHAAWESLLHPEDRTQALKRLSDYIEGRADRYEVEFRLRAKSGGWRWISSRGHIVARAPDGTALRFVGTHRDFTGRMRDREELRRERDRAQAYLDIAEVMLVALDPEGRIALINRKGCRLLGYDKPEELVGKDWFATCLPEAAVAATREVFRRMMAGEIAAVEYHENPALTRSGAQIEVAWHNAILCDEMGRIAGALTSGEDITERRRAERALEKTVALLSQSEEISHVGSWELDVGTGRLVWSDELYRIYGLEPRGISPSDQAYREILHPDDCDAVAAAYADALRRKREGYESTHRLVRPGTGEVRHVHEKCAFERDETGAVQRVFGMVQDITDRQEADEALRASEEKYRLLVENAGEAVFVAQDGMLKFTNPATERIIGRPKAELESRPFVELIHPDDRALVVGRHRRRLAGEDPEGGYEFRVVHAGGAPRWVAIDAVRIQWDGRPATLNFVSDVTERRAAEEARRESDERFRRVFEVSPIGMVIAGPDFRFSRANEAFCRMIGYSEDELRELRFMDVTHPDHREADVAGVSRAARGEIAAYRTEKRYVRKDGRVVWASVASAPVRDAGGRVLYFLTMVEDITTEREAAAALAESERKYRDLANDLPTCVFETDLSGLLTYANRTGLDLFGYSEDEILGKHTLEQMVTGTERERAMRTFRTAVEQGTIPAGEYTALRKDGTSFPALVSSRAIQHDGKAIGVRGILVDITERVEFAKRIERALTGTIHALAMTTEMRDPYTAGHQERVTQLAVAIGRKLGFDDRRLEGLRIAALLHDVGKVSVPAEILSKPSALTEIEMGIVRFHPRTGYVILREIEFPWPVAEIVLQHHERMDGSGYPDGIRGDEILLEARILAVADTVAAMTAHRPYRAAVGDSDVLEAVRRGSRAQYDGDVVSACIRLFREDGFRFDV